jgi:hypothetical protein
VPTITVSGDVKEHWRTVLEAAERDGVFITDEKSAHRPKPVQTLSWRTREYGVRITGNGVLATLHAFVYRASFLMLQSFRGLMAWRLDICCHLVTRGAVSSYHTLTMFSPP